MEECFFESSWPDYVLDRVIVIGKGHEHRVSGYKLARASEVFREELRGLRAREVERSKAQEGEEEPRGREGAGGKGAARTRSRSLGEMDAERLQVSYGDSRGLETLLSFVHCQEEPAFVAVAAEHVPAALKAALFFRTPAFVDFLLSQLSHDISPASSWQLSSLARQLRIDYPPLDSLVTSFLLEHFLEAAKLSPAFLQSSYEDLHVLLTQDALNVKDELALLTVITAWIDHNTLERAPHFPKLLETLRLGLLSSESQTIIANHKLVHLYSKEVNHLLTWARMSLQELATNPPRAVGLKTQEQIDSLVAYLHKPRAPREALVVVGGWEGNQDDPNFGPSKAIQIYNNRSNSWRRIVGEQMGLDEGHAYSGCVLHKNKVYVIGGYVASGPTQTLKAFDLELKVWRYLSPMHEKRNYITTCLLDGFIYTIGGHNGRNRLSSVERYDPIQNHWTFVCPMKQVRSDAGCDSLMGKLYVCGGFDGHHFYASVEMYDPKVDQWSSVAPMSNIRSGVSVITYKQFMFAIGGNDGLQRLRTVERFDPAANRWLTMPSMIRQRSNFCLAVLEDEIYVMGGWSDETNSTIALVEKWHPGLTNQWVSVQQLFMPASANCCCTIKGISNICQLLSN